MESRSENMGKNNNLLITEKKNVYLRLFFLNIANFIAGFYILAMYDFKPTIVSLMFTILIPFLIFSFFYYKDIFHPFNIFFMTTQFVFVYNMIDVNANKDGFRYGSLSVDYREESFVLAIIVIMLWYIMMYIGYNFSKRIKNFKVLNKFNYTLKKPKKIAYLLISLAFISFFGVILIQDGIDGMILALSNRTDAYEGMAYLIELVSLGSIGALVLLYNGNIKSSMFFIVLSFIMMSAFGGRGAAFFGSIFPYLICYHHKVNKVKISQLLIVGFITVIFAIALGNYRLYQESRLSFDGMSDILSTIAHSSQGGEILPSLVGTLMYSDVDYGWGKTLINIIFAPIPRGIWSNKPQIDDSGIISKVLMGNEGWGLPPGPYGISFYNFGFIGVIVVGFVTGLIVYKFYKQLVVSQKDKTDNNIGLIFFSIIIPSVFNLISTSYQINIIWYSIIFLLIKRIDNLIAN